MTTPTTYTTLHIFCIPEAYTLVNDTLRNVDPSSTGDNVSVPYRLAGTTSDIPSGYGGSWVMTDTTNQALRAAIRDAGWRPRPTNTELTVWSDTTNANIPTLNSGSRVWIFDGNLVQYDSCLSRLGLARMGLST